MNPMTVRRFCFHVCVVVFPFWNCGLAGARNFTADCVFLLFVSLSIPLFSPHFMLLALVVIFFFPSSLLFSISFLPSCFSTLFLPLVHSLTTTIHNATHVSQFSPFSSTYLSLYIYTNKLWPKLNSIQLQHTLVHCCIVLQSVSVVFTGNRISLRLFIFWDWTCCVYFRFLLHVGLNWVLLIPGAELSIGKFGWRFGVLEFRVFVVFDRGEGMLLCMREFWGHLCSALMDCSDCECWLSLQVVLLESAMNLGVEMVGASRRHGSGGPVGPVLIPKCFVWPHGGRTVFLTGSFTR